MSPVADQQHRPQAARTEQPRRFACILESVAGRRFDQQRGVGHAGGECRRTHDLRLRHRSGTTSREHQQRSSAFLKQPDAAIDPADQRGRGRAAGADAATEDDDGIGILCQGLRAGRDGVGALDARGERGGEKAIDVAVEHRAGVRGFDPGAQILDHLIRL